MITKSRRKPSSTRTRKIFRVLILSVIVVLVSRCFPEARQFVESLVIAPY